MHKFTIDSNPFLNQDIQAFYHTDFLKYGNPGNPDYLNILKNDPHHNWTPSQLNAASDQLKNALVADLPAILSILKLNTLVVLVIPRSKADKTYRRNQMLFKSTVQMVVNELEGFEDGSNYIIRHINTKTTHLRRPTDYVNDGALPYPGITSDTCNISKDVRGKEILLIDDIYTKNVNIDEDAIQALFDRGAKSVLFYAVGRTV